MGGVLKRTAICIILLLAIDPIFNFAMKIQGSIVSTIPRLILGTSSNAQTDKMGKEIAWNTLSAFFTEKDDTEVKWDADEALSKFLDHANDGCPLLGGVSSCKYKYTFIISTACGAFLIYSLLGILLDVGIRVIKLGLVRLLYPIPVTNYITKKDSLNNFFKNAISIYTDLFIRIGILYFIIYFIDVILGTITSSTNIYETSPITPTTFEKILLKVILIIALFMFANKAPGFICSLLGIEGKGEDFKDMFKPAWSRAGGAVGQMINPFRDAYSNTRDAWKNNKDISGKAKRFRRVLNAARHGAGGLVRGTADAFSGMMAGDDWQKMNERHRKSIANSHKRNQREFAKRDDKRNAKAAGETLKEYQKKKRELEERLESIRQRAIDEYNKQQLKLRGQIAELEAKGKNLTVADQARLVQLKQTLSTNIANRDNCIANNERSLLMEEAKGEVSAKAQQLMAQHENIQQIQKDNDEAIRNVEKQQEAIMQELGPLEEKSSKGEPLTQEEFQRMETLKKMSGELDEQHSQLITAQSKMTTELLEIQGNELYQYETKRQELDQYQKETDASGQVVYKNKNGVKKTEEEYMELVNAINADSEKLSKTTCDEKVEEFNNISSELESLEKKIKTEEVLEKRQITIGTRISSAFDEFTIGQGVKGESYIKIADSVKNTRSSIYVGEAMSKMARDYETIEIDGVQPTYKIGGTEFEYGDIAILGRKVEQGTLSQSELDDWRKKWSSKHNNAECPIETLAQLNTEFQKIEKQAGEDYINAHLIKAGLIDVSDPTRTDVHKKLVVKGDYNPTIIETFKRFKGEIESSNLSPSDKKRMLDELMRNPGAFFKKGADLQEVLRTQGTIRSTYDNNKKDS